jgi:hypothetical protein
VDSTGGKRSSVRIALDAGAKWHVRVYSSPASRAAKPTKSRITLIDENTGRTLGSVALNGISVDLAGGR